MEFRVMKPEDTAFLEANSISRGIVRAPVELVYEAFSLEHEGKLLGSGGLTMIVPGTAWAWVDLTGFSITRIKTCYGVISEWMEKLVHKLNIRRLQAYVDLEHPEAVRLVEHLGFTRESVMWDFLDGRPAALYVKIYINGEAL